LTRLFLDVIAVTYNLNANENKPILGEDGVSFERR